MRKLIETCFWGYSNTIISCFTTSIYCFICDNYDSCKKVFETSKWTGEEIVGLDEISVECLVLLSKEGVYCEI